MKQTKSQSDSISSCQVCRKQTPFLESKGHLRSQAMVPNDSLYMTFMVRREQINVAVIGIATSVFLSVNF